MDSFLRTWYIDLVFFLIQFYLFICAESSWKRPREQLLKRFSPVTNISSCSFPCLVLLAEGPLSPSHTCAAFPEGDKLCCSHQTSDYWFFFYFYGDFYIQSLCCRKPDLGSFPSHTGHIFADMSFQLDYPSAAQKQETTLNLKPLQTPETRGRQKWAAASLTTVRAAKSSVCRRTTDLLLRYAVLKGISSTHLLSFSLCCLRAISTHAGSTSCQWAKSTSLLKSHTVTSLLQWKDMQTSSGPLGSVARTSGSSVWKKHIRPLRNIQLWLGSCLVNQNVSYLS